MSTMRIDKIINRYISSQMRLRQRTANQKAIKTDTNMINQGTAIVDDLQILYDVRNIQSRMKAGGNDDNSDDNYDYDECVKEQQKKREVRHCCEPCRYANICWTRDKLPHQSLSSERVIVLRNGDACPDYELSHCDPRSNLNQIPNALLKAIEKRKAKEELDQKLAERRRLEQERQDKNRTEMLKGRSQKEDKKQKEPNQKKPELEKGKEKEQPKKQKPTKPNTDRKKRKKAASGRLPAGGECQLCGREIGNDQNGVCTPCGKKIRNIVANYVNSEKTYEDDSQYDIRSVPSGKGGRMAAQLNDEPSFSVVVLKEQDNSSLVERITEAINRSGTALNTANSQTNSGWQTPRVDPSRGRTCLSGCSAEKRFDFSAPSGASPEFNGGSNMRNMSDRNMELCGGGGVGCRLMDGDDPRNNMRPFPMMNNINNNNIPCINNNYSNNMSSSPQATMPIEKHEDECQGVMVAPYPMPENQLNRCTCNCARCRLQDNPMISDLLVKALQIFIEKFQMPTIEKHPSSSHLNKIKSEQSNHTIRSQTSSVRKPPGRKLPGRKPSGCKPPFSKTQQRTASPNKVQENKKESPSTNRKENVPPLSKDNKPRNRRDKKKDKREKKSKCEETGNPEVITCPCCNVKIRKNFANGEVLASSAPSRQQIQECPNRKPNSNIDIRTMHPRHLSCFSGCPGHRRTENSEPKPQLKGCGCPTTSTRYVGGGSAIENGKQKILSPISHYRPGVLHRPLSYMVAAGNANRRSLVKTAAGTTAYEKKCNVRIRN